MGKKEFSWSVSYKDVFSFDRLLGLIIDWLKTEGYVISEEYLEKYYSEKRSVTGKEVVFWWDCKKKGTNKYFERVINIDFTVRGLNKVELIKEGQKIKADKGDLKIDTKGILLFGEDISEFKTTEKSLMKHLLKFFESKIYKDQIGNESKAFATDLEALRLAIKQHLDTKGFIQEFKSFHPRQ